MPRINDEPLVQEIRSPIMMSSYVRRTRAIANLIWLYGIDITATIFFFGGGEQFVFLPPNDYDVFSFHIIKALQ
jgi:hypothetical protein